MRFFAFIMAVLVLVLSFMPCTDDKCAINDDSAPAIVSQTQNHHEHNDADLCSPFCTCNCCSGFSNQFSSSKAERLIYPSSLKYNDYLLAAPIEISLPVWQPPKFI